MKSATRKEAIPLDPEFIQAVDLMKSICAHNNRINAIQSKIDEYVLYVVADDGKELADCQMLIAKAEERLEALCRAHPEWFDNVKNIKTFYGTFGLRKTGKLVIPDEASTIRKIRRHGLVEELLRKRDTVDLEACERLPEEALAKLGIESKTHEKFKATPAKTDTQKILEAHRKSQETETADQGVH